MVKIACVVAVLLGCQQGSCPPRAQGDVMLDHTVQCWGANFFGELLDNSLLSSETPIGIRL